MVLEGKNKKVPHRSYIEKFEKAITACVSSAEESLGRCLPKGVRFDLSPCRDILMCKAYKDTGRIFEFGSEGLCESKVPVIRTLWFNGKPPDIINLSVCRTQWGSTVIEVAISDVQCIEGTLPQFEINVPKTNCELPNVDSF